MSQYKIGTVTVTNGSNVVTGSGTLWSTNVFLGNSFNISLEDAIYSILAINSDTEIILNTNYVGSSGSSLAYQICTDFTPNLGLYETDFYDADWPILLKHRTIRKIDEAIGSGVVRPPDIFIFASDAGNYSNIVNSVRVLKCDGLNDEVQVLEAIEYLRANGKGGKITFSEGSFYYDAPIDYSLTQLYGISFKGQWSGSHVTDSGVWQYTGTQFVHNFAGSLFRFDLRPQNLTFENILFRGYPGYRVFEFKATNSVPANNIRFENVLFFQCWCGIYAEAPWDWILNNVNFYNHGTLLTPYADIHLVGNNTWSPNAIKIDKGRGDYLHSPFLLLENAPNGNQASLIQITNYKWEGNETNDGGVIIQGEVKGLQFIGNNIFGVGFDYGAALLLGNSNACVITNNYVNHMHVPFVSIGGSGNLISHNTYRSSQANYTAYVLITGGDSNVVKDQSKWELVYTSIPWIDDQGTNTDTGGSIGSKADILNALAVPGTEILSITSSSVNALYGIRTTDGTSDAYAAMAVKAKSSGVIADGFGASLAFIAEGSGTTERAFGNLSCVRDGSDGDGAFVVSVRKDDTVLRQFKFDGRNNILMPYNAPISATLRRAIVMQWTPVVVNPSVGEVDTAILYPFKNSNGATGFGIQGYGYTNKKHFFGNKIGIGIENPNELFEVYGNIAISQFSNGAFIFPDSTAQTTAAKFITVIDESTVVAQSLTTLTFTGAGVTATGGSGTATVTIPGAGTTSIFDETTLAVASLNPNIYFQGAGVTASNNTGNAIITIPADIISTGVSGGQIISGGTGASETLTLSSTANATKGNIIFGNSVYKESTNRLGLGTTSPGAQFHQIYEAATAAVTNFIDGYGTSTNNVYPIIALRSSNGTYANPTATTSGQVLGEFNFRGKADTTSNSWPTSGARVYAVATQNWGAGNRDCDFVFETTSGTTRAEVIRGKGGGGVNFGSQAVVGHTGITKEGGFYTCYYAKETLSKGNIVYFAQGGTDLHVSKATAGATATIMPVGIVYEDVTYTADNTNIVKVVWGGRAEVLWDTGGTTPVMGYVAFVSSRVGAANGTFNCANNPASDDHWAEVGHLSSATASSGSLYWMQLHFN